MKIKKVLIANRVEIACRVARTLSAKGIRAVAIYSDGDRNGIHLKACDEAYRVGADPAVNSYLNQDKIIELAKKCGADAIHPGYGFLSENYQFAKKCEDAGICFIGPRSDSIKMMGLKDQAKDIAKKAGVPTIPGFQSSSQDLKTLEKAAKELGTPLLIKAVAGGGGKGMVVVDDLKDFSRNLEKAQREAQAAFGNGDVLLEKYFPHSKHIEVQVFGDGKGNAVHLYERECSMQRRHQKVIEEAPSPSLTSAEQEKICASAVALAKAVSYRNAGTVEFIYDPIGKGFYFLEMNTRLQVEHPVTEMITGLDLVDWQIQVAENEKLPLDQPAIKRCGHSIEARLYAEDPAQNFMPSPGKVWFFEPPTTGGVRVERGLNQNDFISHNYDPMVAKYISYAESRDQAISILRKSICDTTFLGPRNNLSFLDQLLDCSDFRTAAFTTKTIAEKFTPFKESMPESLPALILAAALIVENQILQMETGMTSFCNMPLTKKRQIRARGSQWELAYRWKSERELILDGKSVVVLEKIKQADFWFIRLEFQDQQFSIRLASVKLDGSNDLELMLHLTGIGNLVAVLKSKLPLLKGEKPKGSYSAPMPGKVVKVLVAKGEVVKSGQRLVILEAMKMESEISAMEAGTVEDIFVKNGEQVEMGKTLVQLRGDA
jgi:3-methylcrotonyl-CoA carboxylase alpha subunit